MIGCYDKQEKLGENKKNVKKQNAKNETHNVNRDVYEARQMSKHKCEHGKYD